MTSKPPPTTAARRPPRPIRLAVDTREPWPHPWAPYWSPEVLPVRCGLETGDVALFALPEAAVVERKTGADLLACLGRERERFERELARGRYLGRLVVVVEASLAELLSLAHARGGGMREASIIGSLAAWQRRGTGFFFAGSVPVAAGFAERFLRGQVNEITIAARALARDQTPPS